ncbi:indole-3-glycerol phosphate synthase TrpC [Mediterraneibacter glycyrrhizinilyticus]|nr:indole-3-glycerol phosphate synthase TrpC [Mediterraneibacter glycyrrhizinilyticus]MBM6802179.1 indole-3-glycerol phosphate synthase TrpC [Mediterraneibacter glycyrrhizinilyticus]
MNILETITERTRERIREQEKLIPPAEMRRMAEAVFREEQAGAAANSSGDRLEKDYMPVFERALRQPGMSFICEVKKASPSKGIIAEEFPYMEIAKDYEAAGASAISCLTEPYWFLGSDVYLEEIAETVSVPVLRKDFTCSEYMIWQAKALGASAVLLICSVLDDGELRAYHRLTEELHMSALVEAHDAGEIEQAKQAGARIIGVNNRNLKDFSVDISHSARLRRLAGEDTVFVSESGIRGPEDMKALYENGTDAVLIGEMLMRSPDRQAALKTLMQEVQGR